jgi:uncharacterized iron-regulated membrane protein
LHLRVILIINGLQSVVREVGVADAFKGRLRRLWLDLHLWVGVGLFVLLVPLGLSGSLLVVDGPLDRLLHPARHAVHEGGRPAPLSAYLAAARAGLGGARPSELRLPDGPGEPVVVLARQGRGQRAVWLDPASARVLDAGDPRGGALGFLHRLHGQLLIPGVGRQVVGWMGWAMTFSCATGLWLWWPRGGDPRKGLRWTRSASTWSNLHHQLGFWICLPLAVLSLTGVYIAFPRTSHALFGAPPPAAGPGPGREAAVGPDAPHRPSRPRLTIDQAAALAQASAPGARLVLVAPPSRGGGWSVQLQGRGAPRSLVLAVDDATGAVAPAPPRGAPDPLSRTVRQLHEGRGFGPAWTAVVFLAGLAPLVLGVSGTVMWLGRRRRVRAILAE